LALLNKKVPPVAPIAAARKLKAELAGQKVVMVMSGANLDTEMLKGVLNEA
jgi:threonine dehydratase